MSRRRVDIKPEPAARLKMLCKEQGITQKELAERIFISAQTISKIVNVKASLTEPTATAIIDLFPSYSVEWLMGFSDLKTKNDQLDAMIDKARKRNEERFSALIALAALRGFEIKLYSSGLAMAPDGGYEDEYIVRHGGRQATVLYSDMLELYEDVADYAELQINRKLKKHGGKNDG